MPTTSLTCSYRPLRVGFVCNAGDLDSLTEISRLSSLLWGGIFNPIIPADVDRQFSQQLIKLFHVDILAPDGNISPDGTRLIQANPFLRISDLPHNEIFAPAWQSGKLIVVLLDVLHIIAHFCEKEMRHKPSGFRSDFALIDWNEGD